MEAGTMCLSPWELPQDAGSCHGEAEEKSPATLELLFLSAAQGAALLQVN